MDKHVNRILEQYLRCFVCDKPKKWVDWLPWAEYSYNTSVHTSTKLIPFQVVYGRLPPKILSYVPGTTKVRAVEDYLQDPDLMLKTLRANLFKAQCRMKQLADQRHREVEFEGIMFMLNYSHIDSEVWSLAHQRS